MSKVIQIKERQATTKIVSYNEAQLVTLLDHPKYKSNPLYEVLAKSKDNMNEIYVKPYFDLDVKADGDGSLINSEQFAHLYDQAIAFIIKEFGLEASGDLAISTAHRQDKWSVHLVIPSQKISMQSLLNWRDMNREALMAYCLDTSVYRKGGSNFRMVKTSKENLMAPLIPINEDFDLSDHFITNVKEESKLIYFDKPKGSKVERLSLEKLPGLDSTTFLQTADEPSDLGHLLSRLSASRSHQYEDWLKVSLIIKSYGNYEDFEQFSSRSIKYDKADCLTHWNGFKPSGELTMGTLYYMVWEDYYKPWLNKITGSTDKDHADFFDFVINKIDNIRLVTSGKDEWYYFEDTKWNLESSSCAHVLYYLVTHYYLPELMILKRSFYNFNKAGLAEINKSPESEPSKELVRQANLISSLVLCAKNTKGINEMTKFIFSSHYIVNFKDEFDQDGFLVKTGDQVLDLRTLSTIKMNKHLLLSAKTPVIYRDHSHFGYDQPLVVEFIQLLEKILCKEVKYGKNNQYTFQEIIEYFFSCCGSYLLGIKPREKFQYWYGPAGRNGKSTIVSILKAVMGDYYATGNNCLIDATQKLDNEYLNALKRARLVVFGEMKKDAVIRSDLIKAITGNDDINSRGIFQTQKTWKASCSILLMANPKMEADSTDQALFSRIEMLKFTNRFVETPTDEGEYLIDYELKSKLPQYNEIAFHLICVYAHQFIKDGYKIKVPAQILDETTDYQKSSDEYGKWFNEYYEDTGNNLDFVSLNEMWKMFQSCHYSSKQRDKYSKDEMRKSLHVGGYKFHPRYKIGGVDKTNVFSEIRLKPSEQSEIVCAV